MSTATRSIRLALPRHRIHPGAVVVAGVPGRPLRFRLPARVRPGSTVVVRRHDEDVAVVITLLPTA
jgi:hypothetical protein